MSSPTPSPSGHWSTGATPRMTIGSASPSPPAPAPVNSPPPKPAVSVPSQKELSAMLKHETAAEIELVRRGEATAVMRINQLKAVNAQQE